MPREISLPPEFKSLKGRVQHIQRKSATELSGSCPKCGDTGHVGRDLPDRFVMFLAGGNPRGFCRRCGYFVWADQTDPNASRPTKAELDRWRAEQIQREEARKRSAERALAHLRDSETWRFYHEGLGSAGKRFWLGRGVPEAWQSFWSLGWTGQHQFGGIVSDAASIPIMNMDGKLVQIKYRLVDESKGLYRNEVIDGGAHPFICDVDADWGGHVFVVEGEIKSQVVFLTLDDSSYAMLGLPGLQLSDDSAKILQGAGRVTLVLDPGAKRQGLKLAREIGIEKTWLLVPSMKVDDGINSAKLSKREVKNLLGTAIELSQFVTG